MVFIRGAGLNRAVCRGSKFDYSVNELVCSIFNASFFFINILLSACYNVVLSMLAIRTWEMTPMVSIHLAGLLVLFRFERSGSHVRKIRLLLSLLRVLLCLHKQHLLLEMCSTCLNVLEICSSKCKLSTFQAEDPAYASLNVL